MKKERQAFIRQLIANEPIATQEELLRRLEASGYKTSQSTLSRDVQEMHLVKKHDHGQAYYAEREPQTSSSEESASAVSDIFRTAILRADYAGHIAVLHCQSGTASAICVSLDQSPREDVVGTIAGDDTVFVLLRTEAQAESFAQSFSALTGNTQA